MLAEKIPDVFFWPVGVGACEEGCDLVSVAVPALVFAGKPFTDASDGDDQVQ